jgi:hypothetical protein
MEKKSRLEKSLGPWYPGMKNDYLNLFLGSIFSKIAVIALLFIFLPLFSLIVLLNTHINEDLMLLHLIFLGVGFGFYLLSRLILYLTSYKNKNQRIDLKFWFKF